MVTPRNLFLVLLAVLLIVPMVGAVTLTVNITHDAYFDRAWNDTFAVHRNTGQGANTVDHIFVQDPAPTQLYALITANSTSPYIRDYRFAVITVPTGALTPSAIISAATITGYVSARTSNLGQMNLTWMDITPAVDGTLTYNDFNKTTFTPVSDERNYASFATPNASVTWTLNAAGLARINKNGNTTFALVSNWTIQNLTNTPSWSSGGESRLSLRSMSYAGGQFTPSMSITYSTDNSVVAHFYMNVTNTTPTPPPSDDIPLYGAPTIYQGHSIGGNYLGTTDYSTYSAGYDAEYTGGSSYQGTTVTTKSELINALNGASSGDVVFVAGTANIDMGSTFSTEIPAGVTLASDRGSGSSLGGLIHSSIVGTSWERPIFVTAGSNVSVTGLRMQGETYPEGYLGVESQYRTGIQIWHGGANVSNCNFTGFGYSAISSFDIPTSTRPIIHFNLFQLQQNRDESYGVSVQGGDALVEANVFYKNRHSITGTGVADEKYTFRYNTFPDVGNWGAALGGSHVDAHGEDSVARPNEAYSGTRYEVYHNNLTAGGHVASIHQRGYPSDGMYIYNNTITGDGAYTGTLNNVPIFQTYQTIPGLGHMFVNNNTWNGVPYSTGSGILWFQDGS